MFRQTRGGNEAEEGDLAVLYERFDSMNMVKLVKGGVFNHRYGRFNHNNIIGQTYGSKIHGTNGWLWLLPPSPERWMECLTHRTQIMYAMDISYVVMRLNLRPGSLVAEAGTGSGCLTTALARAVCPHGQVSTFEFNEVRVEKAIIDFEMLQIRDLVTVTHRDVCANGLLPPFVNQSHPSASSRNLYDAVFLDLPSPWAVVPSVSSVLRPGGVVCFFSPCLEQVQRTYKQLVAEGTFGGLQTVEVLLRSFEIKKNLPVLVAQVPGSSTGSDGAPLSTGRTVAIPQNEMKGHTAFLTFATRLAVRSPSTRSGEEN